MIKIKDTLNNNLEYAIDKIAEKSQILFFDIETTGFSRKYNFIYLIGVMYIENDSLCFEQYLAEYKSEESDILREFYTQYINHSAIIQYNGDSFDIPFIKQRGALYNIIFDFSNKQTIDIYKIIKPHSRLLKLENLKQKTLELMLGLERTDTFSGGELIPVYDNYCKNKDEESLNALLCHNREDVIFMGNLLSLLSLQDLFNGNFSVTDYGVNSFVSYDGEEKKELTIKLFITSSLPFHLSHRNAHSYILGKDNNLTISIPVVEDEMKYFFDDYKNYYYLVQEDMAMHKDVASFMDKKYRKPATAATCYIKKKGQFLPVGCTELLPELFGHEKLFKRMFLREYKSSPFYIELQELNDNNINQYSLLMLLFAS